MRNITIITTVNSFTQNMIKKQYLHVFSQHSIKKMLPNLVNVLLFMYSSTAAHA